MPESIKFKHPVSRFIYALASPLLACFLFVAMALVVAAGTWHQKDHGIYIAKRIFFDSWFLWAPSAENPRFPVFPGGMFLMSAITVNLTLAMALRQRWRWANAGLIATHAGILLLIASGWVTFVFGVEGRMALVEGESSNRFYSYHDWELAIVDPSESDANTEYVIDPHALASACGVARRAFTHPALPFTLTLTQYARNAQPAMLEPSLRNRIPENLIAGDFYIRALPAFIENERNIPTLIAIITDNATGAERRTLLWGLPERIKPGQPGQPLSFEAGGHAWQLALRRKSWTAPFSIALDHFTHEYYPNSMIPKIYASDVRVIEGDENARPVRIGMNEPLRAGGHTFFQSGFDENPPGAPPGRAMSILAVVRNPAERWPVWATLIVTAGMAMHFLLQLGRYLRRERRLAQ